eukprot:TRINITY_DN1385_c0_g1_i1.p1 TRINITY_DN1385_c0_g1~~TRINITY_DN1385_c0_g1_i1.p1  ORF type:complete len:640 (-),score=154.28 TRINITY_DN1385_c0_g1_i1:1-1920(-)
MSSRAVRKMLEAGNKQAVQLEDDEDEESSSEGVAPVNPFSLLLGGDDSEEEEEEEEEKVQKPKKPQQTPKKGKKKKGKAKSPEPKRKEEKQKEEKEEDIDAILEKFSGAQNQSASVAVVQRHLFDIQAKNLNSNEELKRIFGSEILKEQKREQREQRQQRQNIRPNARRIGATPTWTHQKKTTLVKAKNNWPPLNNHLTMQLIDSVDGVNYFVMNWSDDYKRSQDKFYSCVNTGDPNSLARLLQQYPYQIDAMLQLSEACKQTGELDMAVDLIERILYRFETAWHHLFNPINLQNVRFEYRHQTNRSFFLAIFRHIQMLGRRGCPETALEYCKLLLKLDPSDPLRALLMVDYYAIRSKNYNYLLDLFFNSHLFRITGSSVHKTEGGGEEVRSEALELDLLPNFLFSCAFAKFRLELESNVSSKAYSLESGKVVGTSDELIQHAFLMFPSLLPLLCGKIGVDSLVVRDDNGEETDLLWHPFFQNTTEFTSLPLLNQLVSLYVENTHQIWKDDKVLEWLKPNLEVVVKRVDANDVMVVNCKKIVLDHYSEVHCLGETQRHILLTEHSLALQALPPDVVQEGLRIYDDDGVPTGANDAQAGNPLLLFLQSLLPWFQNGMDENDALAQVARQFGLEDDWGDHQ